MHDLFAAQDLLKAVLKLARKNNLKKVKEIRVGLGEIIDHGEKIKKENLIYNFNLLAKNTPAEGAKLVVHARPGQEIQLEEVEGS